MKLDVTLTGSEQVRRTLLQIGRQAGQQVLAQTAEDVEQYVGEQAGKHSRPASEGGGALNRSTYMRRVGDAWEIGNDLQVAPHALFVHWGTKPHKIRAKGRAAGGKNLLRFVIGSRFISKHEVNHPGYKGDPWLVRAAQQAPLIFERHLAARLARITGA